MSKKSKKPDVYRYKYLGDVEATLPGFLLTVKKGDTIEVDRPINNPLYKLVQSN